MLYVRLHTSLYVCLHPRQAQKQLQTVDHTLSSELANTIWLFIRIKAKSELRVAGTKSLWSGRPPSYHRELVPRRSMFGLLSGGGSIPQDG